MSKNLKAASLAAAIALAMGSTAAWGATAPSATQLPGKGAVTSTTGTGVSGTVDATTSTLAITTGGGNSVITWGSGSAINPNGVAGFNVGHDATVNFTGGGAVLNIDSTSNPSQILGTMTSDGSLYVANKNGIIVGKDASIMATAALGLIANQIDATTFGSQTGLAYNGTGGDVTVADGATLSGSSVLVTGGGTVNVGLSNINTPSFSVDAGVPSQNSGSFVTSNKSAQIVLTGDRNITTLDNIASAGNASSAGNLDLTAAYSPATFAIDGTFTNTGTLTLGPGATIFTGNLINQKTIAGSGSVLTVKGALTNNGEMGKTASLGSVTASKGLINTGALYTNALTVTGDLNNQASLVGSGSGSVTVTDGRLINSGLISGVSNFETKSDPNYKAGADYSIINQGAITSSGDLSLTANSQPAKQNGTIGSVSNTGSITLGKSGKLTIKANDDVTLSGKLFTSTTTDGKTVVSPVSAKNPLGGDVSLTATQGTLTVYAPVYTKGDAMLAGSKVLALVDVQAKGVNTITAGDAVDGGYAVMVGEGATVAGSSVTIAGDDAGDTKLDHPNVALYGTVAGNNIHFNQVSDVLAGPAGSLLVTAPADKSSGSVAFDFTGWVRAENRQADFRNNYLPINLDTGVSSVALTLNPVAYKQNGTNGNGKAGVNILVNGDVSLSQTIASSPVQPGGIAVTGVNSTPNTHLVLQSTGDIKVAGGMGTDEKDFYWPGYVYLGTINADDKTGNPLPATLGMGAISVAGNFSNVLPGDRGGVSGIHFMTQLPVDFADSSRVVTNANAWVNFATDTLTQFYNMLNVQRQFIYSGQPLSDTSNVVTYLLAPYGTQVFHTHPVENVN